MLQLQGQTPAPAKSQLHASTLLTWGGRRVSWINREGSAGWREECQRCWQLGRRLRSLWSTAARPHCRLLAPHLHSYAAVFAHSRRLQSCDRHVTRVDVLSFALCLPTLVLTRVGVGCVHFDRGILFPKRTSRFPIPSLHPTFTCATTPNFKQNFDDCMSVLVHTLRSCNLLDCEVTGGDYMSIAIHSPSGWPFGVSSKEKKIKTHQCQTW